MRRVLLTLAALSWMPLLPGCIHSTVDNVAATHWPEADALFRQDPRWVGGDDAYSIDLGKGRTVWLFGDTFIDPSASHTRQGAAMIRNSIGLQTGCDPSNSSISFHWRVNENREPLSFFPEQGADWFWPGHGIRLGDELVIFLMRVHNVDAGLGFEVNDWDAVMVDNPDDPPDDWQLTWLDSPANDINVIVGSASVLRGDDFVYAFGSQEGVPYHPIYLVRWPVDEIQEGNLGNMSWWGGYTKGWCGGAEGMGNAIPAFDGGQTELTVHFDGRLRTFVCVQSVGFGPAQIGLRVSQELGGPWSEPQIVYQPPEYDKPNIMIYAGKAHPQLEGADLVLTYATNSFHFEDLFADTGLYYPRFVRLMWETCAPKKDAD